MEASLQRYRNESPPFSAWIFDGLLDIVRGNLTKELEWVAALRASRARLQTLPPDTDVFTIVQELTDNTPEVQTLAATFEGTAMVRTQAHDKECPTQAHWRSPTRSPKLAAQFSSAGCLASSSLLTPTICGAGPMTLHFPHGRCGRRPAWGLRCFSSRCGRWTAPKPCAHYPKQRSVP